MKAIYIFITILISTTTLSSQELSLEWRSMPGMRPFAPRATGGVEQIIKDYDGDGSTDFIVFVPGRNSIVVVNGRNRDQRYEFNSNFVASDPDNLDLFEVYLVENVRKGHVDLLFGFTGSDEELKGLRTDNKVVLENGIITFPKTHTLINVGDFDQDGKLELLLDNEVLLVAEIWGID